VAAAGIPVRLSTAAGVFGRRPADGGGPDAIKDAYRGKGPVPNAFRRYGDMGQNGMR